MRALAGLAAFACASAATAVLAAPPTVRSLFVGIDHYTYSYKADPGLRLDPKADPDFHDLRGAVADVALIKQTLERTYRLKLDDDAGGRPGGPCLSPGVLSITLTEACATRANILAALEQEIAESALGDIVLFYFAGHGSQHEKQSEQNHVTGKDETIVPVDARRPPGAVPDIRDDELKLRIDQAIDRGVSVVTIFDSCHSGTATRDLATTRTAPDLTGPLPPPQRPRLLPRVEVPATVRPYQVHLAAAAADEEAHETVRDGTAHGVFTLALSDTLLHPAGPTYLDIARETRWRLEQSGHRPQLDLGDVLLTHAQTSQAEGPLATPFLGLEPDPARAYPAEAGAAGHATIMGGALSGVTVGSSFAIFRSDADAGLGDARAIGRGVVAVAGADTADLRIPLAGAPLAGTSLWVVERAHDYGARRLRVAIEGGEAQDRALVAREIAALGGAEAYATVVESEPQFVIALGEGRARFRNADGQILVDAGPTAAAAFARRLGDATRAAANYFELLGLRGNGESAWGRVRFVRGDCVAEDCGFPTRGDEVVARVGDAVDIYVKNRAKPAQPLYRYVLFLDGTDFSITVLSPPDYSNDPPLPSSNEIVAFKGALKKPGRGTVLLLLTQAKINVAALRQDPVRDIAAASDNDLERLLRGAGAGTRGDAVVRTGAWQAITASLTVTE